MFNYYIIEKKSSLSLTLKSDTLLVVLEGEIILNSLDCFNKLLGRETILCIPLSSDLLLNSENRAKVLIISFNIEEHFSKPYTDFLLSESVVNNLGVAIIIEPIKRIFNTICYYLNDGVDMSDLSKVLLNELFIILRLYYNDQDIRCLFYPILGSDTSFRQLVLEHCLKVNRLEDLATLARYSKSGFIKKFHRCFGQSPYKWILQYKAKRILLDICYSDNSFNEISDSYGISNYSYFYIFCKKHYGAGPRVIRKKGLKKINFDKMFKSII